MLSLHVCCASFVRSSAESFRAKARHVRCSSGCSGSSVLQGVLSPVVNARHDDSLLHSALFLVMNAVHEVSS